MKMRNRGMQSASYCSPWKRTANEMNDVFVYRRSSQESLMNFSCTLALNSKIENWDSLIGNKEILLCPSCGTLIRLTKLTDTNLDPQAKEHTSWRSYVTVKNLQITQLSGCFNNIKDASEFSTLCPSLYCCSCT